MFYHTTSRTFKMRTTRISLLILGLPAFAAAQDQFFKWNNPRENLAADNVHRRQTPPPGYHPEFGSCGSGTTCENACGLNWISCQASTDLSLFCYNSVDLGQTCCENGSGRACERGYYCAWQDFGGRVWCCEDGQSLEECGLPRSTSATTNLPTSSGVPNSSSTTAATATSTSSTSEKDSGTATTTDTLSPTNSQCPAFTVTSWATTTAISTITIAEATVTVTGSGVGCFPSVPTSRIEPSSSTSMPTTITGPPMSSTTSSRPPITNGTTPSTSMIVTAGAGDVAVNPLVLVMLLLLSVIL